jgi:hypothetical protein
MAKGIAAQYLSAEPVLCIAPTNASRRDEYRHFSGLFRTPRRDRKRECSAVLPT